MADNIKDKIRRLLGCAPFEIVLAILILGSVVLTVFEVQARPGSFKRELYSQAGLFITALFIIELFMRWYISESSRKFIRNYWIDILAVLPVIRPLRIFRVFRLLRIFRLGVLLNRRSRKLAMMFHEGIMEHIILLLILLGIFFLGGVGMYILENENPVFDSLQKTFWFSLFTLMAGEPVGGEPLSFGGKIITASVMLGGFTLFAVFTGVVSAVMVSKLKSKMEAKDMELAELNNHYLLCGWNRSGNVIIRELQASEETHNTPVVIICEMEDEPELPKNGINRALVYFVRGDYTSTEVLKKSGVERAKAAVLLADKSIPRTDQDRDARTILAALTIEKLKPGIFTCAELLKRENQEHLRMAGVEDIVVGDEYAGNLIAHSSRAFGLVSIIDELLTATWGNQFHKIPVPDKLVNKSFGEGVSWLKRKKDCLLVSLETSRNGTKEIVTNPPSDYPIIRDDNLIIISPENHCK
ncbi:MAG: NAD-binding protein [Deltaproteobacteria bacterium]|nr:NAD-binding protein [Deltaproteobacteria bacterium]